MSIIETHGDLVSIPDKVVVVKVDEDWIISFILIWGVSFYP
jgi:hypothetical protein